MLNPAHILETALLILMAFLAGCAIGYLARRLTMPKPKAAAETAVKAELATPAGPALVVAPAIAPLPAKPQTSYASRLAAAAGHPEPDGAADLAAATASASTPEPQPVLPAPEPTEAPAPTLEAPEPAPAPLETAPPAADPVLAYAPVEAALAAMEPVAQPIAESAPSVIYLGSSIEAVSASTETQSVADAPPSIDVPAAAPAAPVEVAPPVVPEPPYEPVRAEDVPQIDEAVNVLDPVHVSEPPAELAVEPIAAPEPVASIPEPPPVSRPEPPSEDAESAAMRAIEGNWTPRRAAPSRPVPHPEHTGLEVDAAMASARSAVAAATAAATAAIAENSEPPSLDFDSAPEATPETFLAGATPEPVLEPAGLAFEPARPRFGYGRPEGLAAPRDGRPDNLKQIKGMTAAVESSLYELGIYHFDQLAALDQKAVVWLDHNLALHGRIGREKWLDQARDLSRGRQHALRPVRR